MPKHQVVIIGAGQAGVCLSYFLQQKGIDHVVLEKDKPFAAWHNRWQSFHLNTANWMNVLPGGGPEFVPGASPDGLASKQQALDYFQDYLLKVQPPLHLGVNVETVEPVAKGWQVTGRTQGDNTTVYESQAVVLCQGGHAKPVIPAFADRLRTDIPQLTVLDYHEPASITTSHVLVVGNGSSGTQIALDLASSRRFQAVALSLGSSGHFPWRIAGIPVHRLAYAAGLFDIRRDSWLGRRLRRRKKGDPASPPSPAVLKKKWGVTVFPRWTATDGHQAIFQNSEVFDLNRATVIWCTGLKPDVDLLSSSLRAKIIDQYGQPLQQRGVAIGVNDLYFLGMRFQYTVSSHILYGVGTDARYVAERLAEQLKNPL